MKNFKHLLVMFLGIVLVACNDDPDEVVDPIITVTPPPTADFTLSKNPATWFETEIQTRCRPTGPLLQGAGRYGSSRAAL